MISDGQQTVYYNNDGTPTVHKYFVGTQLYHGLNALDSAGAAASEDSEYVSAGSIRPDAPSIDPYMYTNYLTWLPKRGEAGGLYTQTINNNGNALTINVAGVTDTIQDTWKEKTYVSGPTLPFIAQMMTKIIGFQGTPEELQTELPNFIKEVKGSKNIYTLDALLNGITPGENYKDRLLRFLCDWKGFGDAEATRKNALIAYSGAESLDNVEGVLSRAGQPSIPLYDFTRDELSWLAKRLRGLSSAYQHGKFVDCLFVPSTPLTAGQKAYARFTQLMCSVNQIIGLTYKFGNTDVVSELITNLEGAVRRLTQADQEIDIFNSFKINQNVRRDIGGNSTILNIVIRLLNKKLENALGFFRKVQTAEGGLSASIKKVVIINPSSDVIDNLLISQDVSGFMITPGVNIETYCNNLEEIINSKQEDIKGAEILIKRLPPTEIVGIPQEVKDTCFPSPIYETQIIVNENLLKQNNTISLEFGPYKTILICLIDLPRQLIQSPITGLEKLNLLTKSLYQVLQTFYDTNEDWYIQRINDFFNSVKEQGNAIFIEYKGLDRSERQGFITVKVTELRNLIIEGISNLTPDGQMGGSLEMKQSLKRL
jgi:hypothetical protein